MIIDVTAHRKTEEAQQLLIGELNHRVKNTLAVIQAVAQKTSRQAKTPSEFVESFNGRIQSMARIHTQLSESNWQGTNLHALIQDQLLQDAGDQSNLKSSGPQVALDPQVATHLGMVLHELGTNSRKYGAFSNPTGIVTVEWTVADRLLHLKWLEQGGPAVAAPIKQGFGSSVIARNAAAYDGNAQMHCTSEGIIWEISWSLPETSLSKPVADTAQSLRLVKQEQSIAVQKDQASGTLRGKRILVVEDEVMVGLIVASNLEEAEAIPVGPYCSIDEALKAIETEQMDAALLDANLRGMPVGEIAAALTRRNIPFAFVTGYGRSSLPVAFQSSPILAKPFTTELLLDQVLILVSCGVSGVASIPRTLSQD